MEGRKDDVGKPRTDLLDPQALLELAKVAEYGSRKYEARNWEKGMDWGRVYAALQRHSMAYWSGEDKDPETGLSHMAHAMWCCMVLIAYQQHGAGKDDRPWRITEPYQGGMLQGADYTGRMPMDPNILISGLVGGTNGHKE